MNRLEEFLASLKSFWQSQWQLTWERLNQQPWFQKIQERWDSFDEKQKERAIWLIDSALVSLAAVMVFFKWQSVTEIQQEWERTLKSSSQWSLDYGMQQNLQTRLKLTTLAQLQSSLENFKNQELLPQQVNQLNVETIESNPSSPFNQAKIALKLEGLTPQQIQQLLKTIDKETQRLWKSEALKIHASTRYPNYLDLQIEGWALVQAPENLDSEMTLDSQRARK